MKSKRCIDISIFGKDWRKIDPMMKLTWYSIWNSCNDKGVYVIDEELFEFEEEFHLDLEAFKKTFSDHIKVDEGTILLLDFARVNSNSSSTIKKAGTSKKFNTADFKKILIDLGADPIHVNDWIKARQKKKATNSETALKAFVNECKKYNYPIASAVQFSAERGYSGFKYVWVQNEDSRSPQIKTESKASKILTAHENVARKFIQQANGTSTNQ